MHAAATASCRLLAAALLGSLATAQAGQAAAAPDRGLQRVADDARHAARALQGADCSFRGAWSVQTRAAAEVTPTGGTFTGAVRGGIAFLEIDDRQVLQSQHAHFVRKKGGDWTSPDGETPDCPLDPRALADALAKAEFAAAVPCSHEDRPAIRASCRWTGEHAAWLVDHLNVPHGKAQAMLEHCARFAKRTTGMRAVVDGTAVVDPSLRRLLAVQLRVAVITDVAWPEREQQPAWAAGLPPLANDLAMAFTFALAFAPTDTVPMPPIDPALQQRLVPPAK
jgi:hypothetical protein